MRIRWTVPAADDLESIKNYLQLHYPHFAEPTVRTIYQRIRSLKTAPQRGRPGHRTVRGSCRLRRFHMWSSIQ
jgi:plasmid stabilization system protein ParE